MSGLWPSDDGLAFGDVFDEGDPSPGEEITDTRGLVSYHPEGGGRVFYLCGLGISSGELLRRLDPDEHTRIERLVERRDRARTERTGTDEMILIPDALIADQEEAELLERLGLTLDEARDLCHGEASET